MHGNPWLRLLRREVEEREADPQSLSEPHHPGANELLQRVARDIAPDALEDLGVARLLAPVMAGERAHQRVGHCPETASAREPGPAGRDPCGACPRAFLRLLARPTTPPANRLPADHFLHGWP
jgi:hypothetical protein